MSCGTGLDNAVRAIDLAQEQPVQASMIATAEFSMACRVIFIVLPEMGMARHELTQVV